MVSKNERRRQLARAKWERQQQRKEQARRRQRRRNTVAAAVIGALVVVGLVWASLGWVGDDEPDALTPLPTGTSSTTTPSTPACEFFPAALPTASGARTPGLPPTPTPTPVPTSPSVPSPADASTPAAPTGAAATTAASPSGTATSATPAPPPTRRATITINGRPVVMELNTERAPCAVQSFAHLAGQNFFDDTRCHRLVTSDTLKALQCGDPTGTGSGGPGYTFDTENTVGITYLVGTVAMANTGAPRSTGSQFFIVYENSQLPSAYTVLGQVVEGLDVVQSIGAGGVAPGGPSANDGPPNLPAVIDTVVVEPAA